MEPFILVKANTKAGYEVAEPGDTINLAYPNSITRRGRVGKRVAQTLTSPPQQGVVIMKEGEENMTDEMQVRKLTPKEYFRLMGFDDSDVDLLMKNGMSNTQLYKMAGNSIMVTMLEYLFCQIFDSNDEIWV